VNPELRVTPPWNPGDFGNIGDSGNPESPGTQNEFPNSPRVPVVTPGSLSHTDLRFSGFTRIYIYILTYVTILVTVSSCVTNFMFTINSILPP